MKIGILTYHRTQNYGAFLQAYGLCQRLNEESDIEAEVIDFRTKKEYVSYTHRDFEKFAEVKHLIWAIRHFNSYRYKRQLQKSLDRGMEKMLLSREHLMSDSIEQFQIFVRGKYDIIIAGSDEIWKIDGLRGFPTPYWLPGDLGCIKMSYAASSRNDFSKLDSKTKKKISKYLNDFSFISVRDEITRYNIVKFIKPRTEVDIFPDPSFIYDFKTNKEHGRSLLKERYKIDTGKKLALIMMEDDEISAQIKSELSNEYQLFAVYSHKKGYRNVMNLDPFEWLDVIAGVDLVCASYFHAICFSIINNVPFLAFAADGKESKLSAILKESGNLNKLIKKNKDLFQKGYIKKMVSQISEVHDSSDYLIKCRKKFNEYIFNIRELNSLR